MWYAMATRVGGSVAFCDGNPPRSMQCWKGSSAWTGPGRGFGHHGIDRSIGSLEMVERWKRSGSRVGPQFQGRNGRGSGSRLLERQGGRDGMKRPNPFHLSRFRFSPKHRRATPGFVWVVSPCGSGTKRTRRRSSTRIPFLLGWDGIVDPVGPSLPFSIGNPPWWCVCGKGEWDVRSTWWAWEGDACGRWRNETLSRAGTDEDGDERCPSTKTHESKTRGEEKPT